MTIHGSKLKLKWLRYLENLAKCVNTLPMTITFDPTVGFSICLVLWKLDIQRFLGTTRSIESESGKPSNMLQKLDQEKAKIANVSRVADGPTRCVRS